MLQNKKLEKINYFSFLLKQAKGKSEDKTRTKTDFWSTTDRRESLMILNRMIRKDSQTRLKPIQRKHKKPLKYK
jgi:hypothetical protein